MMSKSVSKKKSKIVISPVLSFASKLITKSDDCVIKTTKTLALYTPRAITCIVPHRIIRSWYTGR